MADWTWFDYALWLSGFIVLPAAMFALSQCQSHKTYREMRERIAQIGAPKECMASTCPHPEHPSICLECGCDWMVGGEE